MVKLSIPAPTHCPAFRFREFSQSACSEDTSISFDLCDVANVAVVVLLFFAHNWNNVRFRLRGSRYSCLHLPLPPAP
jgi:hypothetical protein